MMLASSGQTPPPSQPPEDLSDGTAPALSPQHSQSTTVFSTESATSLLNSSNTAVPNTINLLKQHLLSANPILTQHPKPVALTFTVNGKEDDLTSDEFAILTEKIWGRTVNFDTIEAIFQTEAMGHHLPQLHIAIENKMITFSGEIIRRNQDSETRVTSFRHSIPSRPHAGEKWTALTQGFDPFDSYFVPAHSEPEKPSGVGLSLRAFQRMASFLSWLGADNYLVSIGPKRKINLTALGFTQFDAGRDQFQFNLKDEGPAWHKLLTPPHWRKLPADIRLEWTDYFAIQAELPEIYLSPARNANHVRERTMQWLGAYNMGPDWRTSDPSSIEFILETSITAIIKIAEILLALLRENQHNSEFIHFIWSNLAPSWSNIEDIINLISDALNCNGINEKICLAVSRNEHLCQLVKHRNTLRQLIPPFPTSWRHLDGYISVIFYRLAVESNLWHQLDKSPEDHAAFLVEHVLNWLNSPEDYYLLWKFFGSPLFRGTPLPDPSLVTAFWKQIPDREMDLLMNLFATSQ